MKIKNIPHYITHIKNTNPYACHDQTRKIKKGRRREKEQLHEGEEQEQEQEQKKEITTQGAVTVLVV